MKLISIAPILLFLAVALQGAQAQTKPDKVGTREELRACMNSESELAVRRKALEPRNDQNREEAASIRAEAEQMAADQKRIEEEHGSMDRFNRRVKTHNARVQVARANAESFRSELESLNKAVIAHNAQCGGVSFKTEDKEAILKERESAPK